MRLSKMRYSWLVAGGLLLAYLATRLYHPLSMPMFTDEAVYTHWAQLFADHVHRNVFISLDDGKQPLFVWLGYPFIRLVHDPLLAMRLVSVMAGAFTTLGLYVLTNELLQNKRTALMASLLYVIYPFALVYDRMALYDDLLASFAVWSLYVEILLVRRRQLWIALLGAVVLGGALLTKSSAIFYVYLLPFSLLLFNFKARRRHRDFIKWLVLAGIMIAGALGIASILKLSPHYHFIGEKNALFVEPFNLWIKHPLSHIATNLPIQSNTLIAYATFPVFALALASLALGRAFLRQKVLLAIWFVVPFAVIVLFGTFLSPRYLLFTTMPLLVLVAASAEFVLQKIRPWYLAVGLLLLLSLPMLWKDRFILTDFYRAPIPAADHMQFIAGYTSGDGLKEAADYLRRQARGGPLYVGGEGTLELIPEGLEDYLHNDPNITIQSYWPITPDPPANLVYMAQKVPTYFVFYAACPDCQSAGTGPKAWQLQPVLRAPKHDGSSFNLYKVMP
jgi:4-amino-4-deoxy-L-arabinose transferase-like glycosyltransferase